MIVEFEEGDPDRPLITGRVYNAEAMPPGELPADKTKSIIRDHGGNELIMEGHDGVQQIKMFSPHYKTTFTMGAPRNPPEGFSLDTEHNGFFIVKKNVDWDVDGNHTEDILLDETIRVHGDSSHTITLTSNVSVGGARTMNIGGVYMTHVGMEMNEFVAISRTDETIGFRATVVGGYKTEKVFLFSDLSVGDEYRVSVGTNLDEKVKINHTSKVGGYYDSFTKGKWHTKALGEILLASGDKADIVAKNNVTIGSTDTYAALVAGKSAAVVQVMVDGTINITGNKITISGEEVAINGKSKITINGGPIDMGSSGKINIHGNRIDLN